MIAPTLHRLALVTALASLALSTACAGKDAGDESESTAKPEVAATTARATVEPFTRMVTALGEVVARPGRYAALSAPSATRVARVLVTSGQRVAAGQPLVEFEQATFASAAGGTRAALIAAERAHERAQRLAAEGIVPRKDAEAAAADLGAARAADVAAQRTLQLAVLRSPVSGVVTRLATVLGQPADAGQVLVEIADPSTFDVVLALAPGEAAAIRPGNAVTLTAGDRAGGELVGAGTVASVAAAVDSATRTVAVRVAVTTPRRSLRLGERVFGEIAVETRPGAVVVPLAALVPDGAEFKVFVVDAKGTAVGRSVKVGGRTETKVEILAGLKGGETVVTQGAFGVDDSTHVVQPGARPDKEP